MLQSILLTGISSPRLRRCSVGEEARVSFPKLFLFLSCFTFSMIAPKTFSKMGVSHVPGISKAQSWVLGIQNSHRVYEHLALKVCRAGLNIARVVGFHICFSCITFCKKLLRERFFRKTGFKNRVKALLQSQVFETSKWRELLKRVEIDASFENRIFWYILFEWFQSGGLKLIYFIIILLLFFIFFLNL